MEFFELILVVLAAALAFFLGRFYADRSWGIRVADIRAQAVKQSRAVLGGQFSEQLAPYLPDFPFSPTEARFIGKPIDFIVFEGMDDKAISEVAFVEVKSAKSRLSGHERRLRQAIESGHVRWVEYRIPSDVTAPPEDG